MDYCHPCRRHLNGALACPGCGTPADACRAYAGSLAPDDDTDGPDAGRDGAHGAAYADQGTRHGRRSHRRKRNKVLLIGVGLVLAIGALSLAQVSIESPFRDPGHDSAVVGGADERQPSDGASSTGSPSASDSPSTSHSPTPSATRDDRDEQADEDDQDEDEGDDEGEDEDGKPGDDTGRPSEPSQDQSSTQPPPSTDPPPSSEPPPSTSEPDPDPHESCTWVIVWWCS